MNEQKVQSIETINASSENVIVIEEGKIENFEDLVLLGVKDGMDSGDAANIPIRYREGRTLYYGTRGYTTDGVAYPRWTKIVNVFDDGEEPIEEDWALRTIEAATATPPRGMKVTAKDFENGTWYVDSYVGRKAKAKAYGKLAYKARLAFKKKA